MLNLLPDWLTAPFQQGMVYERQIASGGEADIWTIKNDPHHLAKLYKQPCAVREAKLETMLRNPAPDPCIAWPRQVLRDHQGNLLGMVMPRFAAAVPIASLYNPAERWRTNYAFNWKYQVATAHNLSHLVSKLHRSGYVYGDLSGYNVLVDNTARTYLVDADAMQVPNGRTPLRCVVGTPPYFPPELLGKDLSAFDRTEHQDNFSLGILNFQLLMEGAHPYAGVWRGPGDPPSATMKMRHGMWPYAYGLFNPPPGGEAFKDLPQGIQDAFRACFTTGAKSPWVRPSASTWCALLADLQRSLVQCCFRRNHWYSNTCRVCPWCRKAAQMIDVYPDTKPV